MITNLLRPFLDLDGIIEAIEYRSTPTQPYEALDIKR